MNVRKGTPPPTVERTASIDFSREEVLAILTTHVKSKMGPNLRFDNIQVTADEKNTLHCVTINGAELVQLVWKEMPSQASAPTPAATTK